MTSVFYRAPVFGWFLRDAVEGRPDAKYFFAFNLVSVLGLAICLFGYPVVIGLGLFGTFAAFVTLIGLTSIDVIENARRKLG